MLLCSEQESKVGSCKALFERKKESIVRFVSCLFGVALFAIVLSKVLQE